MKRVLSLVLALVLVLGMIPMGFAADSTAGTMLKGYGIIAGDENGNLNEDQNLNRAEMMVVLARMMGKGAEAQAFALPSTFTDLEGFGWAVPWIAYAEMNEWTAGVGANMFNPAGNVTAQEAAVFMLKALGYEADVDFNWANAVEFATAKGLFAGVDTAATSPILRGDLFTMMITTLNTEVKSGAGKLGIVLGYMEEEVLKVTSVKALNLTQIEVKFNMAVDSDTATDDGNYVLTDEDGDDLFSSAEWARVSFDLQADDKTVIISLFDKEGAVGGVLDQQTEAILEIDGVEAADDEEMFIDEFVSEIFEFNDVTIPKALKAEVIGNDTIKVTFSEPIKSEDSDNVGAYVDVDYFEVDGGDYIVKEAKLLKNNTEINVELYSKLDEGKLTVEVGGMDDFAGFNVVKTTFEINVVEDKEAPTVVGYKDADRNEVTLIFNEDIEGLFDDETLGNVNEYKYFYHTNATNTVKDTTTSGVSDGYLIDGNELTLFFDNQTLLPEGTAYVYVVADAVQDLWENANNKIVAKVEITVDRTAPAVKDIDVDLVGNYVEVEIEFTEDISEDSDFDDAFLIIDKDGDEVSFDMIGEDDNDKYITLQLDGDTEGVFKLTIQDLEDMAGNEIVKVTQDLTIDDLTAPLFGEFEAVLYKAAQKDQLLKITFGEKMATEGAYSVLDLAKYMVYVDADKDSTVDKYVSLEDLDITPVIKLVDDGEAIEIRIKSLVEDDDGADLMVNEGVVFVKMGRVADAAGNKTTDLAGNVDLVGQGFVYVNKVEVKDENKVVITFDDKLTTFKASDLKLYEGTTTATALEYSRISTSVNDDNETVVTITTVRDFDYDGTLLTTAGVDTNVKAVLRIAGQDSKNIYGETIALKALAETKEAVDKYAPAIAKYTENDPTDANRYDKDDLMVERTSNDAIKITFTESLEVESVSRLSFSIEGETVSSFAFGNSSYGVNSVIILYFTPDGDTKVEPKVTQNYDIADAAKNKFKASTTLYSVDMRP
ncbi:MAG: hypothetical protein GT601_14675 [Acidaminobacter sp.]|uniref:Ig-like domain-containing protein n=1 Tax=Acidaminobacter sp. TaxID=1872102 RepID=UPI00138510C0|nr:Ig-like domain-containing protein [Acidaminobacter sp.]MZQ98910.1 hypothetical protein [Acidaminobacter sp.]